MKRDIQIANTAIAAAIAIGMGVTTSAIAGQDNKQAKEKCYGVVKAGQNDCGTAQHACQSQATKDADPNEWMFLPAGTCERIVGGMIK